ncbi:hypothetical protein [Protofrankia symbiont of Coriaria ruscifolia]|uniref:hypothetical protein n=1 Tax=Protofrankia symbiont of Coriaria ruscifolia TaxID=1306542 RepID=UPI001F5E3E0D|nr:hypothetical protein [Protofrankia symbiont of Coriaria ruscifolia]
MSDELIEAVHALGSDTIITLGARLARLRGLQAPIDRGEVYAAAYQRALGDVLRRFGGLDTRRSCPADPGSGGGPAAYRAVLGISQREYWPHGRAERAMTAALGAAEDVMKRESLYALRHATPA